MKRAGFTMIELIFVIVILGILAAVAVPKLAATRTDAQVSKIATDASTLVGELGTYYTAQGTFKDKNASKMTNVKLKTTDDSLADNDYIEIGNGNGEACLKFTFDSVEDGNVTISSEGTSSICKGVKAATTGLQKTFHFGGANVSY